MPIGTYNAKLPGFENAVSEEINKWQADNKVRRLWEGDATVWTGNDENKWLGWLGLTEDYEPRARELKVFSDKVKAEKFTHILLLGMGGSSLCPEVLKMTFGKVKGYPELLVLDSTDPLQIKSFEKKINLCRTLFIVSSKSGSTLEPNIFRQYFFERMKESVGAENARRHFIAITDPKSKLQETAEKEGFRYIFSGAPSIGGRFSALSNFGLVPAALMGLDVQEFLARATEMACACAASVAARDNPGVVLGAALGVLGNSGCNKITLVSSPQISDFGAWLEQLLAESTGKEGKALIPIDGEELGRPEIYGKDRLFIYTRLNSKPDRRQDAALDLLQKSGFPVVRITIEGPYDLGAEFFRWEMATAIAGSIMGVNPFNQPDVEASKEATRKITSEYETKGFLPAESPFFEEGGIKLFADEHNARNLEEMAGSQKNISAYLKAHLGQLRSGDYFALLAYLEMNSADKDALQEIRHKVRDTMHMPTCLGFGPRFLHSTGQAYKGGPNTGVFLQITCDEAMDLPVPAKKYTFGVVKAAQAQGDFQVLAQRGRRVLRVHLQRNVAAGLRKLKQQIHKALTY